MKNNTVKPFFLPNKLLLSKYTEYLSVFFAGAIIYFCIEILWRGYSHITMFFAGGLCLGLIYYLEKKFGGIKLFYRCIIYAFTITAVEFIFGVVFNIILKLNVWDYSERAFNILGQVCPLFFMLWMFISIPAVFLCKAVRLFFDRKRKQIHETQTVFSEFS